ncbi:MAG: hypothetical protein NT014_00975 [Candidatus Omnitrophica bacterium]|nr:hypothetical protein [Candidatus Omnitrophota bacterium]
MAIDKQFSTIFSRQVVREGEEKEDFLALEKAIKEESRPAGVSQELLVDKIIAGTWRQCKLLKFESELFGSTQSFLANGAYDGSKLLDGMIKYQKAIENSTYKATKELEKLKQSNKSVPKLPKN